MTPDEVRMLDNRYALLFIRGEAPVMDDKFDILKHPNIAMTADGGEQPYCHGNVTEATGTVSLSTIGEGEAMDIDAEVPGDYEVLSEEEVFEMIEKEGDQFE